MQRQKVRCRAHDERPFTRYIGDCRNVTNFHPFAHHVRHHDRTNRSETTMNKFKAPLGFALAMLVSTAAFAQQPNGAVQTVPQVDRQAPAPAAPSVQTQTTGPQAAPMQRSAPDATVTQERTRSAPSATQDRRGSSRSVTSDRSDRGWDGNRSDRRWNDNRRGYRDSVRPAFAFISGPRIIVRPGWCRGLHRGWHSAPGMGQHAGTHRGLFRC
jgi:hypothetical protein